MASWVGYRKLLAEMLLDNGLPPEGDHVEVMLGKMHLTSEANAWLLSVPDATIVILASGEFDDDGLVANGIHVPAECDYPAILDECFSAIVNHYAVKEASC